MSAFTTWPGGNLNTAVDAPSYGSPGVPNAAGQLGAFLQWEAQQMRKRQPVARPAQQQPMMQQPMMQQPMLMSQPTFTSSRPTAAQQYDMFVKLNPYTGKWDTAMPWHPGAMRSGSQMDSGALDFYSKLGQQVAPIAFQGGGVSYQNYDPQTGETNTSRTGGSGYDPWAAYGGGAAGEANFEKSRQAQLASILKSSDLAAQQNQQKK